MFMRKGTSNKIEKKSQKYDGGHNEQKSLEGGFENLSIMRNKRQKFPRGKVSKDIYTLILLLSFLFFVVATVFLYLDLVSYK